MSGLPALLTFEPSCNALICTICRVGVRRRELSAHFKGANHGLNTAAVKELQATANTLFLQAASGHHEVAPSAVDDALPSLNISSGFACTLCDFPPRIATSATKIESHCRIDHDWINPCPRGRPFKHPVSQHPPKPHRPVIYQRLFGSGSGSRYFEVRDRSTPAPLTATPLKDQLAIIEDLIAADEARARNVVVVTSQVDTCLWIQRTGWDRRFESWHRDRLRGFIAPPDPKKEAIAQQIWTAFTWLAVESERAVTHCAAPSIRRRLLQTRDGVSGRPLLPYVSREHLHKHLRPWQRIVTFLVRTNEPDSEARVLYSLDDAQSRALQDLIDIAGATSTPSTASSIANSDSESLCSDDETSVTDSSINSHPRPVASDGRSVIRPLKPGVAPPQTPPPLERALLVFCVSLITQLHRVSDSESPLLCALGLLSVTPTGWMRPNEFASIMSAVLKFTRFMLGYYVISLTHPDMGRHSSSIPIIYDMTRTYTFMDSVSPIGEILSLRAYALATARDETAMGVIDWIGDSVLCRSVEFSMDEFRIFVSGLLTRTRDCLLRSLLFVESESELPSINLHDLRDDHTEIATGWNFLHHKRNTQLFNDPHWLLNRRVTEASKTHWFRPRPPGTDPRSTLEPAHLTKDYFTSLESFRTDLAVLCHILGGQPARGTELLSIRHTNIANHDQRNIFIENGMVCLVTYWHKAQNITRESLIIYRYLPFELGKILIYYLWLVLPFADRLQIWHRPRSPLSKHLWCTDAFSRRAWRSERLRRALEHASLRHLGQSFNLQTYRHIAIAISRRYLTRTRGFFDDESSVSGMLFPGQTVDIFAEQAAHSSHMDRSIYARLAQERAHSTHQHRAYFRNASCLWHEFLGLNSQSPSASFSPTGHKRGGSSPSQSLDVRAEKYRVQSDQLAAYLVRFQELLPAATSFRPGQEDAIKLILQGWSPVFAVLPTGGGKSLLFILPASFPSSQITIVVVPLLSLRQSLFTECTSAGIRVDAWDPQAPVGDTNIILITPEGFLQQSFQNHLRRLRAQGRVDRIVFDECHSVLSAKSTYRSRLLDIWSIGLAGVQLVYLTATLPPSLQTELWDRLRVPPSWLRIVRVSTARTNLAYYLRPAAKRSDERLDAIQKLVSREEDGAVIIYTRSIRYADQVAVALNVRAYHRDAERRLDVMQSFLSGETRVLVGTSAISLGINRLDVRLVVHGEHPWSLLEYGQEIGRAGRDGKPSRCVMFHSRNENEVNDLEEPLRRFIRGPSGRRQCRRISLEDYFDGVPSRGPCIEGKEQLCDVCAEPEAVSPAAIRPPAVATKPVPPPLSPLPIERQQQQHAALRHHQLGRERKMALQREKLPGFLGMMRTHCMSCLVSGRQSDHVGSTCSTAEAVGIRECGALLKKRRNFHGYCGCYRCATPQSLCDRYRPKAYGNKRYEEKRDGQCQYMDLVWEASAAMFFPSGFTEEARKGLYQRITEGLGTKGEPPNSTEGRVMWAMPYLYGQVKWWEMETCNLFKEVCLFYGGFSMFQSV